MVNRSKNIGTRGETLIVRHAISNGFPDAERLALAGASDQGDVRLCKGVIVESKAGASARSAGPVQLAAWAAETETERRNQGADFGVLVVQRLNRAVPGAGGWAAFLPLWAVLGLADPDTPPQSDGDPTDPASHGVLTALWSSTLDDVLRLLRWTGYGDPLPAPPLVPTQSVYPDGAKRRLTDSRAAS
jgi:hypothetical protein